MTLLKKSEYAAHKGWSRPYVSKLAKDNRLVLVGDLVDVESTEALLQRTADPSKTGVAERHQRGRVERGVSAHISPNAPPLDPPPAADLADLADTGETIDFQKARARREHYLARLAENESRKSDGELVEREAVELAAFSTGRMLRDLLLGLPKSISAELAALSDPWEVERHLTTGLRRVLEDAQRLSVADLDKALNNES